MLTQCQQCKKTYSISVDELQQHNAYELLCPHCEEMLGRLKRLGHQFFQLNEPDLESPSKNIFWSFGIFCCVILLLTQLYVFKREQLTQTPQIRLWLNKICLAFQCELPRYKNSADFEVMHGAFELIDNQYYVFQAVMSNQGKFTQSYPAIKLNLLHFDGEAFSQRIFYPDEYLTKKQQNTLIHAQETIEISIKIALPGQKVGGYTFELI